MLGLRWNGSSLALTSGKHLQIIYCIKKSWCPKCAENLSYELSDLQRLAEERGEKCRSNEYNGTHSYVTWTCSDWHEWSASFSSLGRGDWCPHCKFNYKEEITRLIFEKTFDQIFPRIRPEWLINKNGRGMEISWTIHGIRIQRQTALIKKGTSEWIVRNLNKESGTTNARKDFARIMALIWW